MSDGGTFVWEASRHPEWDLMYRKGLSVSQISKLCGAGSETVGRYLRGELKKFPDMQAEHEACRPQTKVTQLRSSWLANIKELSAVFEAESRYPTSSDPDPQRRRLGHWLSVQRCAHRDGRLTQAKLDALSELPKWKQNQRLDLAQKRWQQRLEELQAFVVERGRWPSLRKAESEAERGLGVWLHAQRQKESRAALSETKSESLEASIPGWYTWGRKLPRSLNCPEEQE